MLLPPMLPPVAPGLQWMSLDGIGHKKGRNLCYCLGYRPSLDCVGA